MLSVYRFGCALEGALELFKFAFVVVVLAAAQEHEHSPAFKVAETTYVSAEAHQVHHTVDPLRGECDSCI